MSKRVARQRKRKQQKPSHNGKRKLVVIICSLLILTFAVGILAQWKMLPGMSRPSMMAPTSGSFNASSPSKEYIYAGGRLIATEEPSAALPFAAPTNLVALTGDGSQVIGITWNPVQGAQYYRVERSSSKNGPYTSLSSNVTGTSLSDTNPTLGVAYLYRVCVADSQGNPLSPYSNIDLATAVIFTDDPLGDPQTGTGTLIYALHITQLRAAIDAVRLTAGLSAAVWDQTHPVASNQPIYATHITEMRARLDEARSALNACCGVALPGAYTDPNLASGYGISRAHIKDLRDRVK